MSLIPTPEETRASNVVVPPNNGGAAPQMGKPGFQAAMNNPSPATLAARTAGAAAPASPSPAPVSSAPTISKPFSYNGQTYSYDNLPPNLSTTAPVGQAYTTIPTPHGPVYQAAGATSSAPATPLNGPDPAFAQAQSNLAPGAPPSEGDFFKNIQDQLRPVLDSITQSELAAESAAHVEATKETSAQNFSMNAQGLAGSSEASGMAKGISDSEAQAIAAAKANQTNQLSAAYQFLTSEAYTAFKDAQTRNDTLSANYSAKMQAQAAAVVQGLAASGVSLSSLMQTNPAEYQALLQYTNGDPNALQALFIQNAPKGTFLNNGQPVTQSGNTLVYAEQTQNPDGTQGVKTVQVQLPSDLPPGYTVQSYNQAANGMISYIAIPTGGLDPSKPNNGIISGSFNAFGSNGTTPGMDGVWAPNYNPTDMLGGTGMTYGAINNAAVTLNATGRMPSMGNGTSLQVRETRQAIANRAAALNPNGAGVVAEQSYIKALNAGANRAETLLTPATAAADKASAQISIVQSLIPKVHMGTNVVYNKAKVAFETSGVSDPDMTTFVSAMNTLVQEYGKVQSGSTGAAGLTDAARTTAYDTVNAYMSSQTLDQVLNLMQTEMQNTITGYKDAAASQVGDINAAASGGNTGASTGDTSTASTASTVDTSAYGW